MGYNTEAGAWGSRWLPCGGGGERREEGVGWGMRVVRGGF